VAQNHPQKERWKVAFSSMFLMRKKSQRFVASSFSKFHLTSQKNLFATPRMVLSEALLRLRKEENLYGHCDMNNARRILSKSSTPSRGCWFWSKKLHFQKNFGRNLIAVEGICHMTVDLLVWFCGTNEFSLNQKSLVFWFLLNLFQMQNPNCEWPKCPQIHLKRTKYAEKLVPVR